jgi:hypothetical protein
MRDAPAILRRLIGLSVVLGALSALLPASCARGQAPRAPEAVPPTLRIYAASTLAGALEPCGCVKDMLGGIDHAAAFIAKESERVPNRLVLAAGPLLFLDPTVAPDSRTQNLFKAEALAESFRDLGLAAWAPGANDWAAGGPELGRLAAVSGASLLAVNLSADGLKLEPSRIVRAGGQVVGIAGVSVPARAGKLPDGLKSDDPKAALERARDALRGQGAAILVALLAMSRGDALRLVDVVKGFDVVIVGKPFDQGESNDAPTPPVLVAGTLVVEAPNHLQSIAVVDLVVRGSDFDFADGSGLRELERRTSLEQRIAELERRIADWEQRGATVAAEDLEARRGDLERLKKELSEVAATPEPPAGSHFRYQLVPIAEALGSEPRVAERMSRYYRRVNEHNRTTLADRLPPPVPEGGAGFIGVEKCGACHAEELQFWRTTDHARAYATLERGHKQFNLECVGCHVTGYEAPGGSTVVQVGGLKDVQCEVCHGPGSLHAGDPRRRELISTTPKVTLCAAECHHPPHVKNDWDVVPAWQKILGPGHGR